MTTVLELGEDGDRWIVLGTIDVPAARVAVIDFLRSTLLPGDEDMFACGVEEALQAAPQVIDECRIYGDPEAERSFYQSPIGGTPIPAGYDILGRNAVVLGTRLPDHRTYLSARRSATDDEREALAGLIANIPTAPLMRVGGDAAHAIADVLIRNGVGFRRPVQGEPTDSKK